MKAKKINISSFFRECGLEIGEVEITETKGMYPFNPDTTANWVYFTLKGYQQLREIFLKEKGERGLPKIMACVAVGSGVEVIGLASIFPSVEKFLISDIDTDVLAGSFTNCKTTGVKIVPFVGSLCDSLRPYSGEIDLIHGNVPNLMCDNERDLSLGDDKGTFVRKGSVGSVPEEFMPFALESQFAYLKGAKKILKKGGSVITFIGGRIPMAIVHHLFYETGLKLMPEFSVGFKEQTQPEQDYVGYAALEEEYGVKFDFYKYEEALQVLKTSNIPNPTFDRSGEEVKDLLKGTRVTATEALGLFKKGVKCGHTVHMFRGVKP